MRDTSIRLTIAVTVFAAVLLPVGAASAATSIDGPIDLGTAAPFSALASSTLTNTGPSVVNGDIGLSPGTSITGFPPGIVAGTVHATDAVAAQAQADLTTAYGVASGLTPTTSGLSDLTGLSLTPGVYAGDALSLSGALTLSGAAESVWVFQATSTLTVASGAIITVTGGASACNVFWQVGSSATIRTGAQFVGTVMAQESITAQSAATVTGRLLARNGAVTLDTNALTAPTGCGRAGSIGTSPAITSSAPPDGTAGSGYSHTVTATGTPTPTFSVSTGSLPPGLALDATTGLISGQPTAPGTYTFDITASNGISPDAVASYTVTIGVPTAAASPVEASPTPTSPAALAASGVDGTAAAPAILAALVLIALGVGLRLYRRRLSHRARRVS